MSRLIGLVTGSEPFAGLAANPAEAVLPHLAGTIEGVEIIARATPVSYAALPSLLPALIDEVRPDFVVALGLALGAPVVRVEQIAVNACHFDIADNLGARPQGGIAIEADGPGARMATWDAEAIVAAILEEGIPARVSFHAGTHLCNLTLYTYLGALQARGLAAPCGFLHLPYLPEQVARMMQARAGKPGLAPTTSLDLPSMPLETQVRAVKAALGVLAHRIREHAA